MLAGSLLLYRKRHLESAGDFITVRFLSPVFLVLYTLAAGMILFAFSSIFGVDRENIFLAVGIAVGFITGHMLLKRTVKVFRPATFLGLAVMMVVLFGSMGLTRLDVLGLVRWVPEKTDVASVSIRYSYDEYAYRTTDPGEIEELTAIHQQITALDHRSDRWANKVELVYTLADGRTVTRRYPLAVEDDAYTALMRWFSRPEYVLQTDDVAGFVEQVIYIVVEENAEQIITGEDARELMKAVIADCEAGNMVQDWNYYNQFSDKDTVLGSIQINLPGKPVRYINLWEDAENTLAWLEAYRQASAGNSPQPRS